jgi:uncharacterized protein (DUF58 family)
MSRYEVPTAPSGVPYGSTPHGGTLRLGLTDAGKVVLTGIGFVALTALVFPAFGVLSILVWVLLIALLFGLLLRPKIQISGKLPDRIMAGQSTPLRYVLKNVGRFPAYNLYIKFGALPAGIESIGGEQVIARLGPDETIAVTITIRPTRRGYYQIQQPTCQSSFPFNLFSFGTSHDDEENLIILPAFYSLRMPTRGFYRQVHSGSARPAGRIGYSTEYAGNRPFLPGDSPRRIDARAWARLAVPATREYHDDFDCFAALVLDTHVPEVLSQSQPAEIKELEAAISLCASIAFTINKDRLIDLLLISPDLHRFTDSPRTIRLERIHEILAGVEPAQGDPIVQTNPIRANQFRDISEVVFIFLNWNKTYRQLVTRALEAGCHCTVLLVGEPRGIHFDPDGKNWMEKVRFLPADEILSGQVESL